MSTTPTLTQLQAMTKQDTDSARRCLRVLEAIILRAGALPLDLDDPSAIAESGVLELFDAILGIQAQAAHFTGSIATEQDYLAALETSELEATAAAAREEPLAERINDLCDRMEAAFASRLG